MGRMSTTLSLYDIISLALGGLGLALGFWNAARDCRRGRARLRVVFEPGRRFPGGPFDGTGLVRVANAGHVNLTVRSIGFGHSKRRVLPCGIGPGIPVVVGHGPPEFLEPGASAEFRVAVGAKQLEAAAKWRFAYAELADGKVFRSRRDRRAFAQFAAAAKAADERAKAH